MAATMCMPTADRTAKSRNPTILLSVGTSGSGVYAIKKVRCADCPNRECIPLNPEIIFAHLIGLDEQCKDVAGIYPLLLDDTTRLLSVDFDDAGWPEDINTFCELVQGLASLHLCHLNMDMFLEQKRL